MLKRFAGWLAEHVCLDLIFTPFAVKNVKFNLPHFEYIGYTYIYIFGIRVAKIQATRPWEE